MGNTYKISGRLTDKNKEPLDNIQIKCFDCSFLNNKEISSTKTGSNGEFKIIYLKDHQNPQHDIKLRICIGDESVMTVSPEKDVDDINLRDIIIDVNIGVEGRVIDENGNPVSGLHVAAEDVDFGKVELHALNLIESKIKSFIKEEGILDNYIGFIKDQYKVLFPFGDKFLGNDVTDKNGYYRIIYPPGKYKKIANKDPNIQIIVKDKSGIFELRRTDVYENVKDTIKHVEKTVINRAEIEGWFVTLYSPFKSRFTENNNVEILIDNEMLLEKITSVIEEAESYIYLTQFKFDPDFIPKFLDEEKFKEEHTLAYKLLESQNRGTDVKIIINENAVVPDNYKELRDYFKESKVEVRNFPAKGPYTMHAKVLVVDGRKAFIIGSPFNQGYWDTDKHLIDEPLRLDKNKGPVHDVSIYLEGSAVEHVEEFFIGLWNYLSDQYLDGECKITENKFKGLESPKNSMEYTSHELNNYKNEIDTNSLKIENAPLQIVRSITPGTVNKGEKGVLEAYRKAIFNANDFIYLENQYFTNKYIMGALKKALENNPDLQLIMLINEVPDVPTYKSWQHYAFEYIGLDIQKTLEHPQIGIFTKWSGKVNNIKNCYIHSKVAIVDDIWATVGTANLDGSSLSCAEEFGNREVSSNYLNMEMNALLFDLNNPKKGTIEKFRKTLWKEHLGIKFNSDLTCPNDKWLNLWNKTAENNLKILKEEKQIFNSGILPYGAKAQWEIKRIMKNLNILK
ncbi:phospholipase D-like domain-containing protein [Methanobacterium sp.]|jgi:phosphatidylserine/phosphatidylglycerophosphate/cardiolipin synthase-like enzyme|uniref:phospholipase D-like domain-containing protein n=1 Tax=Methanobacterium sp. TaxID=2164 RepID=UPI0031587203